MSVQPCRHRSGRPNVAQRRRDGSARRDAAGSDLIEAFPKSLREIDVHARTGTCFRNTLAVSRIRDDPCSRLFDLGRKARKPFLRLVPSTDDRCPSCYAGASSSPRTTNVASCRVTFSWGAGEFSRGGGPTPLRTRGSIAPGGPALPVLSTSPTTWRNTPPPALPP